MSYGEKLARRMRKNQILIVNISGRGDKDVQTVADLEKTAR